MSVNRRAAARLLLAAPLWASSCARKAPPAADRVLRVGVLPHIAMAPAYLAAERKFFEQEGLKVTLESSSQAREVIPLLTAGKLDAAMMAFNAAFVNAAARGARIRLVAGREKVVRGCGDAGALFARRGRFPSGVDDAASWRGARAAVSSRGNYREYAFSLIEKHLKLPEGAVTLETMSNEEAFAAAMNGNLDVIAGSGRPGYRGDPFHERFERSDIVERLLDDFQFSYIAFGPTLLDADPAVGGRLLRACLRGARAYLDGETPQYLDEYSKASGLDPVLVKTSCRKTTVRDGAIDLEDLRAFLDWCTKKGYAEKAVPPEDLVDSRFLRFAREEPEG